MADEAQPQRPRRRTNHESREQAQRGNEAHRHTEEVEEDELKYGAEHVIKLFVPVSLCMLFVVVTISNIDFYSAKDIYFIYTPFHETSPDTFTKFWNAALNSLIMIFVIIVMTSLLICLYKFRFYKVINTWLIISTLMLLFFFSYLFFEELLRAFNVPMDVFTLFLFIWNFGVTGILCIHWKGPLKVQQAYLIFIAALMALIFIKYLPEWTTWAVLFTISIWDAVAVLSPHGPLRILVEIAQERNETIFPSLVYSAMAYGSILVAEQDQNEAEPVESSPSTGNERYNVGAYDSEQGESSQQDENSTQPDHSELQNVIQSPHDSCRSRYAQQQQQADADKGVKLGLGDFIFYSVLVGKASSFGDWYTTLACFVAILIGLSLTLLLLVSFKKALPALPISITFGLIFYFFTSIIVKPFADMLASKQIFI